MEVMIPALPCRSINEVLPFYEALGFDVTYQQERPNNYAVVERGGIVLHFFSMKGFDPAQSYSTCIVLVPNVDELRQAFVEGLRAQYGKLPSSGIPRITPLHDKADGGRGFNVIDPGGNWIRISEMKSGSVKADGKETPLGKAIQAASLLADSKGDYAGAVKILDKALERYPDPSNEWVQAMVARAELAVTMGDEELARKLVINIREFGIGEGELAGLEDELRRIEDVEQAIGT